MRIYLDNLNEMILKKLKNINIEICHSAFDAESILNNSKILNWIPAFAGMTIYEIDNKYFYKMNLTNGRML